MKAQEIEKVAAKFCVTLPETSQLLKKTPDSRLYWYKNYFGNLCVLDYEHARLLNAKHGEKYVSYICKGFQLDELLSMGLLPSEFVSFREGKFYFDNHKIRYEQDVIDNNLAESFAQLYLTVPQNEI